MEAELLLSALLDRLGPAGAAGRLGLAGPAGPAGRLGPAGAAGAAGALGAAGAAGALGAAGAASAFRLIRLLLAAIFLPSALSPEEQLPPLLEPRESSDPCRRVVAQLLTDDPIVPAVLRKPASDPLRLVVPGPDRPSNVPVLLSVPRRELCASLLEMVLLSLVNARRVLEIVDRSPRPVALTPPRLRSPAMVPVVAAIVPVSSLSPVANV